MCVHMYVCVGYKHECTNAVVSIETRQEIGHKCNLLVITRKY